MRRWLIGLLAGGVLVAGLLVAVSCGGGEDDDEPSGTPTPEASPTPSGTTATSDDGNLSLFIPDGAMQEGTEVTITSVPHDQLPQELQELSGSGDGYLLEPDGLEFSQPVTATLTLDRALTDDSADTQSAYTLVSFSETAGREVLDGETTYTVGEGTAAVEAELTHFSWITTTRGSLRLRVEEVSEATVSEVFTVGMNVSNRNRELVQIENLGGSWFVDFTYLLFASDRFNRGSGLNSATVTNAVEASDEGHSEVRDLVCDRAGLGDYSVSLGGNSTPREGGPADTVNLNVHVTVKVNCVDAGTPVSTSAPEVTPPPAEGDVITVVVVQTAGCEHTQPGVQSEFLKNVIVTSLAGDPMEGLTVDEQVQGPGLLDESGQITNTLTASATTDTQGEADFVFPIVSFGPYTGIVQRVTLPDGRLAAFDPASVPRTDFTVGETCTPP